MKLVGWALCILLAGCSGPAIHAADDVPRPSEITNIVLDSDYPEAPSFNGGLAYETADGRSWVAHHNSAGRFIQVSAIDEEGFVVSTRQPVPEDAFHFQATYHEQSMLYAYDDGNFAVRIGKWQDGKFSEQTLALMPPVIRTGPIWMAADDTAAVMAFQGVAATGLVMAVVDLSSLSDGPLPSKQLATSSLSLQDGLEIKDGQVQLLYTNAPNQLSFISAPFADEWSPQVVFTDTEAIGARESQQSFLFLNPETGRLEAFRYSIPFVAGISNQELRRLYHTTADNWGAWQDLGIQVPGTISDAFWYANSTRFVVDKQVHTIGGSSDALALSCSLRFPDIAGNEALVKHSPGNRTLVVARGEYLPSNCL